MRLRLKDCCPACRLHRQCGMQRRTWRVETSKCHRVRTPLNGETCVQKCRPHQYLIDPAAFHAVARACNRLRVPQRDVRSRRIRTVYGYQATRAKRMRLSSAITRSDCEPVGSSCVEVCTRHDAVYQRRHRMLLLRQWPFLVPSYAQRCNKVLPWRLRAHAVRPGAA